MLEVLGGLLLFFLVIVLAMAWIGYRVAKKAIHTVRGMAAGFAPAIPILSSLPDPRWTRMSGLLDRSQREQARIARERIRAFVGEGQSGSLGPDETQLLISCERRVPELIDTCLERCRNARPGERCDYAAETLERLVRIGEEAEAARAAVRARDDHRLVTMHQYFDTVATRHEAVVTPQARSPGDESTSVR